MAPLCMLHTEPFKTIQPQECALQQNCACIPLTTLPPTYCTQYIWQQSDRAQVPRCDAHSCRRMQYPGGLLPPGTAACSGLTDILHTLLLRKLLATFVQATHTPCRYLQLNTQEHTQQVLDQDTMPPPPPPHTLALTLMP
jgi:hypothetical protein